MTHARWISLALVSFTTYGVGLVACGSGDSDGGGAGSGGGVTGTCKSTCEKSIALGCASGEHDQTACEASCNQQKAACASMASVFQTYLDCVQSTKMECGGVTDAPSSPDCLNEGLAIFACMGGVDGGSDAGNDSTTGSDATSEDATNDEAGAWPMVPTTIVTETKSIGGLAVDGSTLYWTVNDDAGAIEAMDLPNGTPTVLAADQKNASSVAVDASGIYWVTVNHVGPKATIMHLDKGGTTANVVSSAFASPWRIGVDDQNVYVEDTWTTDDGTGAGVLFRVAKAGGSPTEMFRHDDYLWTMAVDATDVWVASQSIDPGLFRVPIAGGAAVKVTDSTQHPNAAFVSLDATNAYWSDGSGAVLGMPKAGGAISTITTLSDLYDRPYEVVAEGDYVYFTSEHGGVWRAPKTGGTAESLVASGTGPSRGIDGLVVAPSGIYFYVPADLAIKYVPHP